MSETSNSDFAWRPDLDWLTDDLAVGGCFPIDRAPDLARAHAIGAVVDLRREECDDEAGLLAAGIAFLHLPTIDMEAAELDRIERGVSFARQQMAQGRKVLIHCQHGIGRAPLLALCILVDAGWEPLAALAHAKQRRGIVSPSRSQYDRWAEWLQKRGIPPPSYHEFGCIAYRHLANP